MRGLRPLACLLVMLGGGAASAEGEYGPMVGGALIAAQGPERTEVAGLQAEMAFWYGPIGLGLEGARQWSFDEDGPRVATVAASARLLVFRQLVPSFLEPRDVELGFELQGLVERAWWENTTRDRAAVGYGVGIAVRLRGGSDDLSNLLAESRLFVRVVRGHAGLPDTAARGAMADDTDRATAVTIGLGAAFGGGKPGYIDRFRSRPLDTIAVPVR